MSRTSYAVSAAKVFWADSDRKPLLKVLGEATATAARERELPIHYFTHMLYKVDADPRGYVGHKRLKRAQRTLFEPRDPDLDDKVLFAARAEALGIPIPRTLAVTESADSVPTLTERLLEAREHSSRGSIFVKPADGISGKNCFRIDAETDHEIVQSVATRMVGHVFLLQETLPQHPVVSAVHPGAVNCARIHTIRRGTSVEVLPSLMRFGVGTRVVDTPSSGAIFAPIDLPTGRIAERGYTNLTAGAERPVTHPETGVRFADVTLPDWDATIDLVHRAAAGYDKAFVGWDVAFTENGPVFTEGNSNPRLMLAQIAAGGFKANPAWWRVLEPALA